jgi:hypothetical protein
MQRQTACCGCGAAANRVIHQNNTQASRASSRLRMRVESRLSGTEELSSRGPLEGCGRCFGGQHVAVWHNTEQGLDIEIARCKARGCRWLGVVPFACPASLESTPFVEKKRCCPFSFGRGAVAL